MASVVKMKSEKKVKASIDTVLEVQKLKKKNEKQADSIKVEEIALADALQERGEVTEQKELWYRMAEHLKEVKTQNGRLQSYSGILESNLEKRQKAFLIFNAEL